MPTILVVDDHGPTRRPLVRLLQLEGYKVVSAADAFEATTMAKKNLPDLILLDVMIPPMDGLTFLMLLRQEGPQFQVPVILITGLNDAQTAERARELGIKDYLVKSQFTLEELIRLVKKYIPQTPVEA
jgi:CheY-like chemotaxis protein